MNRATIAIEQQLTPYSQALSDAGYRVVPLTDQTLKNAQAVVVQGSDDNFLGIEDPLTKAPVIDATGLTADQVVDEVRRRTAIES
ncbi:MAG: YkuS family protein [Firmicutes bacterium]|jgi:hypothetical protein|nr:YkuS family protein [Bacillota bacterium]